MFDKKDEKICLICYEALENTPMISWQTCEHVFCVYCSAQMVLKEKIECAIDRRTCEKVILHVKSGKTNSLTICEFRNCLVGNTEVMKMIMEDNWSQCLDYYCKYLKKMYNIKSLSLSLLTERDGRKNYVLVLKHMTAIFDLITDLQVDNVTDKPFVSQSGIIGNIISIRPANRKSLCHKTVEIDIKLISSMGSMISVVYLEEFIDWFNTHTGLEMDESKCPKKQTENEIHDLDIISEYFRGLIISKVTCNKNLYQFIHGAQEINIEDKCLICLVSVTGRECGTFQECNHKICLECMNNYSIFQASCPFDSQQAQNLMIQTMSGVESYADFYSRNFETINLRKVVCLRNSVFLIISDIRKSEQKITQVYNLVDKINKEKDFDLDSTNFKNLIKLVKQIRSNVDMHLYTKMKVAANLISIDENWEKNHNRNVVMDKLLEMPEKIETFLEICRNIQSKKSDGFSVDDERLCHNTKTIERLATSINDLFPFFEKNYQSFSTIGEDKNTFFQEII